MTVGQGYPRSLPAFAHEVWAREGMPWLTFIPGIGNDRHFWLEQAEGLSAHYQVLLFDPWGHGESPPPPDNCTFDDVIEAVVQLLAKVGAERSALVGLGFGGSVALATSARHASSVSATVACCCRPRQPDDRRQFWRDRGKAAAASGMAKMADITVDRWLTDDFRASHPDVDALLRDMFKRTNLEGYIAYTSAFADMDFVEELGEISSPVLLLAGENDKGGGPPQDMQRMSGAIAGSLFQVVPNTGHIINHEAPERVTELIGDFLDATG